MIALIKIVGILIALWLTGWAVWANTKPIPDEPCDYKQCPTCPFPCERHEK